MSTDLNKIQTLFQLQDELNTSINSEWKTMDYNWHLYIQTEAVEGIQSFSFKHWKKGEDNFLNAEMELTDIIFFTISLCIVEEIPSDIFLDYFIKGMRSNYYPKSKYHCISTFQSIMLSSLTNNILELIKNLGRLAHILNMSLDNIYCKYIAKKVLNTFRQDHGYKEGTYIKEWKSLNDPSGLVEDNVYLELFMQDALNEEPEDIYTYLYDKLKIEYNNNL
jgi:dimeric dUTPase (all-alpha-NTP-PPase superfamily)